MPTSRTRKASRGPREFYETHREEMDAGAVLLWPEREDLYSLMCLQAEGGRVAFAREKQGSPLSPDVCEWPESYFHAGLWFDAWPEGLSVKVLALDPSKGRDARRGDYSAYVLLGIDARGWSTWRPTWPVVRRRRWWPTAWPCIGAFVRRPSGLEANQYQELLAGEFEAEFRRHGLHGVRPWLVENQVNKLVRIRRLSPLLAAGRLRFKAQLPRHAAADQSTQRLSRRRPRRRPRCAGNGAALAGELLDEPVSDGLGHRLPVG